jgi:hypothetical protein
VTWRCWILIAAGAEVTAIPAIDASYTTSPSR